MSKKKGKTVEELLQEAMVPVEEQPYPIPENWVWVKLGALGEIGSSKRILQTSWQSNGVPFYRAREIVRLNKSQPINDGIYISEELYEELQIKYGVPQENDLLITGVGTVGETYIVSNNDKFYFKDASVLWFKNKWNLNIKYINYFMKSSFAKNQILKMSSGTTVDTYTISNANKTLITFPPLNEQKRIVDKVERLLNKINQAKQLIEEAKETFELRRAAILDKAFRGELTANWRVENNVDFEWEYRKLGDLVKDGPQNGLYKPKNAYGNGTLIVRIDSFYNGEIKEWETLKRLHLEGNEINLYGLDNDDVIINRVNSIEHLGKSALVRNLVEPAVFESNVMRLKLNDKIIPEFLILYLNSFKGLEELRKNAKHAVNQASINQQDVKNVSVPLPIKEEQIEIIRMLNLILNKEKLARDCIDLMENVRLLESSILSKAFRGELGTNLSIEENAIELISNILVKDT